MLFAGGGTKKYGVIECLDFEVPPFPPAIVPTIERDEPWAVSGFLYQDL